MSKPKPTPPPPQPDPVQVANAQTGSNVQTAIANTTLGNVNEITPWGTVTYNQIGTQTIPGSPATTDARGMPVGGTASTEVPRFERVVAMTPAQQTALNQQNQLDIALNQLAIDQTGRVSNLLGQPIQAPQGQNIQFDLGSGGGITRNINLATTFGQTAQPIQYSLGDTNFEESRRRVEDALLARLNPQLERDRAGLENTLINQGFVRGSAAFNEAMDEYTRQSNDARLGVIREGGAEQTRLFNIALQTGNFANAAQAQDFVQQLQRAGFSNDAIAQMAQFHNQAQQQWFNQALARGQFNNQAYAQQLQTDLALRNQPINEITALLGGQQVQLPQFQPYQGGQVAPTPIGDYYYQNAQLANDQWRTQQQMRAQQAAGLYGALGSLAGAGLYGLGRRF